MSQAALFGWWQVLRLALVQACLGSVVVITTSTLNRIMVVELMLPALLPGLLVGLHYAVQMVRPRMGFGADQGRRCTPWMVGGMGVLSLGGCLAAQAIVTMGSDRWWGVALAAVAFAMIGVGVSACGTSRTASTGASIACHAPCSHRTARRGCWATTSLQASASTSGDAGSSSYIG